MSIKSINFSLEVSLVLHHLLGVLLQPFEFVTDGPFILICLVVRYFEFLQLHRLIFSLHVLVLVGLEQLALSSFVVLILLLEVAKFPIELVQLIFQILNLLNSLLSLGAHPHYCIVFLSQHVGNRSNSVFVIISLSMQHVNSLLLGIDVFV